MKTTMIYLRQLLALCVVMVAFAACGDDEKNEGGSSSASGIQLNTIDKITCLSEESTIDINFTAGSDWTAASSATWLKLNKLTGSAGDITLTATIHENESFDIRPATITIKDKSTGKEATISVKQASKGTILFFSSASQNGQTFDNIQISDDSKAFVATVNVTSNYDWTVNTDKSWLSYSKAADANEDGSYTVTFYADFDKLYETGKYGAQSAVAHFEYTSATRTPTTVDYQLDFKGITPSLTFDVDKVELINQNGDGEYIGLATVYSNVAWDFDEKPEFVESVEVLGDNQSAKFLSVSTRIKLVLKNSEIDTDELNAVLTFKDATTDTKLDNIELPIEFAGVGGKYVTYDRSVFKDNDPSDMYPYFMFNADGTWTNLEESFSDMKVEITASDADDIAIYAVKYDANMDRVYTSEIWWMNHNESELTRAKLGKTTSIFSVGERGTDEWSDPTPLEDRFCAIFIVSGTEYPDVYSLFDGNDELREGLRDNMLIIGQKGKKLDFSQFWCEGLDGNNVVINVPAAGKKYEYPYEGLDMEAAQPSFIVGKDLSIEDHQVLNKEDDYDFTISPMLINWGTGTFISEEKIVFEVGENKTGEERQYTYAIVANDGTNPGYVLVHFTLVQTAN